MPRASARTAEVATRFGLTADERREVLAPLAVKWGPGRIVAFVGPSGSGKSTALSLIDQRYAAARHVDRVSFPADAALVDAVCPQSELSDSLRILSHCAMGEAPLWLRRFDELSDGQQFRARLARAIGAQLDSPASAPLIIDEFGGRLHSRAARAVAYNLRKLTTRMQLSVVLATCREDVLVDLQPDAVVRLGEHGESTVTEHTSRRRALSLWRRLVIRPGTRRDYDAFSRMHYRAADELGFVDRVFVLSERDGREVLGVAVFSYGPRELSLRNAATGGRFKRNLKRLNREMRILRRLVIHPDLRGCGIGHRFVRRVLPLVGTPYVECLATMGAVNPVFEKAGMRKIGVCEMSADRRKLLDRLRQMDIDPFDASFVTTVCRRPAVRRIVAEQVSQWYRATTVEGTQRVQRQSPQFLARLFRNLIGSQPVYYIWNESTARRAGRRVTS